MNHLQSNKLISTHQHGFVSKKSCTTNLLESLDYITMNIEMKIGLFIIYLDFSKAFDKVCHRLVAHKLRSYGICPRIVAWVISFLTNRKQRVILGNNLSDWADVLSGVPQGTVLGPTLFIIYINDLIDQLNSHVKFFADNSRIVGTLDNQSSSTATLEKNIETVTKWCNIWKINLNVDKCKIMRLGKGHNSNTKPVLSSDLNLSESHCERDH
jgi:hypothetical protein